MEVLFIVLNDLTYLDEKYLLNSLNLKLEAQRFLIQQEWLEQLWIVKALIS